MKVLNRVKNNQSILWINKFKTLLQIQTEKTLKVRKI